MNEFRQLWKESTMFDRMFTLLFTAIIIAVQVITDSTFISMACAILGIFYVTLVRKGHRFAMYFGITQCTIYAIISFNSKIYGDFLLNTFNACMMIYGATQWKKNSTNNKVTVRDLDDRLTRVTIATFITVYVGMCVLLDTVGGFNPLLDALTSTLSMMGMILTVNGFRQCWIFWNLTNATSMILWLSAYLLQHNPNAPIMVTLFACYLVNSVYATYQWKKS